MRQTKQDNTKQIATTTTHYSTKQKTRLLVDKQRCRQNNQINKQPDRQNQQTKSKSNTASNSLTAITLFFTRAIVVSASGKTFENDAKQTAGRGLLVRRAELALLLLVQESRSCNLFT